MALTGEVGAGGDADRFLFLGDLYQGEVWIALRLLQQQPQPRLLYAPVAAAS